MARGAAPADCAAAHREISEFDRLLPLPQDVCFKINGIVIFDAIL